MKYYVYTPWQEFDKDDVGHVVQASTPTAAMIAYATKECGLYHMAEKKYEVYSEVGTTLGVFTVPDWVDEAFGRTMKEAFHIEVVVERNEHKGAPTGPLAAITGALAGCPPLAQMPRTPSCGGGCHGQPAAVPQYPSMQPEDDDEDPDGEEQDPFGEGDDSSPEGGEPPEPEDDGEGEGGSPFGGDVPAAPPETFDHLEFAVYKDGRVAIQGKGYFDFYGGLDDEATPDLPSSLASCMSMRREPGMGGPKNVFRTMFKEGASAAAALKELGLLHCAELQEFLSEN